MPLSVTLVCTESSSAAQATRISPPAGVNLMAFESRLMQHLTRLLLVGVHGDVAALAGVHVAQPLGVQLRQHERLDAEQDVVHRHARDGELHAPGFELREVQHVVDEPEQMPLAALDALEVLALLGGDRAAHAHLEQLRVAADGVERRAQLVAHHREELALGAVGRFRLAARGALALEELVALHEMVAHVVLASARAERGAQHRHDGRDADGTLEQRDVGVRRELLERARDGARQLALAGEHDDRHVGPRRLVLEHGEQHRRAGVRKRLLGDEHRADPLVVPTAQSAGMSAQAVAARPAFCEHAHRRRRRRVRSA